MPNVSLLNSPEFDFALFASETLGGLRTTVTSLLSSNIFLFRIFSPEIRHYSSKRWCQKANVIFS